MFANSSQAKNSPKGLLTSDGQKPKNARTVAGTTNQGRGSVLRVVAGVSLAALAVSLRRLSGSCYPKGHALREFHHDMAGLLKGVDREYLGRV